MAGEAIFDHQDGSGSEEQVRTKMRFGFDEPGDHRLECDGSVAGIGGNVDVVETPPLGP